MEIEARTKDEVVFNPYHDLFLAEWPETIAARLEWAESRLGIKRSWLLKMLVLEGRDIQDADTMSAAQITAAYEYEVGCWTDMCCECLATTNWDVNRFADLSECLKGKVMKNKCRDWIMEKLFSNWSW